MRVMVSGHRDEKLAKYDPAWVEEALHELVLDLNTLGRMSVGLSGMASGVDLMFCRACLDVGVPYYACVPFDGQAAYMTAEAAAERERLLGLAADTWDVRNRHMVEKCDAAIVVWDGNKGGTHNCFQMLLEMGKPVDWVIPQYKKVVEVYPDD